MEKGLDDLPMRRFVRTAQIFERRIREHDAPTKGIEGPIAFQNSHLPRRKSPFDQDAEVKAGWAAANARDAHLLTL